MAAKKSKSSKTHSIYGILFIAALVIAGVIILQQRASAPDTAPAVVEEVKKEAAAKPAEKSQEKKDQADENPASDLCAALMADGMVSECETTAKIVNVVSGNTAPADMCYTVHKFLQNNMESVRFEPGYTLRVYLPSNPNRPQASCKLPAFE